ncbi:hypothetical protein [Hydrogenophaga sp. 2FB]|uniref:hypothetical protein n=1 Tax=Hydrogenophaga sp. 2FB TaxID=2502187 RepID=UPI0010F5C5FF|nr:hypothetical protein [Hydrogenophaga sp. 2FB]
MDYRWHEAQAARLAAGENRCDAAEEAYRQLHASRMRIGLSRLEIGFNLLTLKDSGAWRGRTGASSFHRFMIEEGLEPKAAVQYMNVARAYLVDQNVDPRRIAMVSMRLLSACIPRLSTDSVNEIVDLLSSLPSAEARHEIEERFPIKSVNEPATAQSGRPPLSRAANRILGELDGMSFDERRDLYRVLHLPPQPLPLQIDACDRERPAANDGAATHAHVG